MDNIQNLPGFDEFLTNLKQYVTMTKDIKEYSKLLKDLKNRKKELEGAVETQMIDGEYERINTPNSYYTPVEVVKYKSAGKKHIKGRMEKMCNGDTNKYEKMFNFIYDPAARDEITVKKLKTVKKD